MSDDEMFDDGEGANERGCGRRVAGGIYLETKLAQPGRGGKPLESYLLCPPVGIDPGMGLSPVGITLIERDGVTHVIDWIGSKHYPNVADFIEEARRMGISRRISKSTDFSKLTRDSRLLLVHARGIIENTFAYDNPGLCPVTGDEHDEQVEAMCPAYFWRDLEPGTAEDDVRQMPSFSYTGSERPDEVKPKYFPAIFMTVPIGQITVIGDDLDGTDVEAFDKASASSLPVVIEAE